MNKKIIMHIDIDSFFVSAERKNNKNLLNKSIAIAYKKSNAIAVSISYEAKEKGVKVPWKIKDIIKIDPDIIIIEPHYNLYVNESEKFFDFLRKNITNKIEIISIDECFLDVSEYAKNYDDLNQMALKIKEQIFTSLNLPVSIGVSYNKFLAKMATNLAKPFNVQIIYRKDIESKILPQSIDNFYGVGIKSAEKLKQLNIFTIKQFLFALENNEIVKKILGKKRVDILENLTKEGDNKIKWKKEDSKTISHQITFDENSIYLERDELLKYLKEISINLSSSMKIKNLFSNEIQLTCFFKEKEKTFKKVKTSKYFNDFDTIYNNAIYLLNLMWYEQEIKSIILSINNLVPSFSQTDLINENDFKKVSKEEMIIKRINSLKNSNLLIKTSDLKKIKDKESDPVKTFAIAKNKKIN
ncbi:DNA polymerase IV [Mesomycoplasma lagogenitalium]|uniref:DNA polymerase IV n=1 Tax=Mesomycoplasma lagogenitalium TaxID=171286 RepID=A0ABY8LVD7_9BACT|nr:DNA polymerase IV [Mesomycoplasma lagogenitalium]WGI36391.1 DNA polymerase IV [Mesomycoplasma lagogenitalium]